MANSPTFSTAIGLPIISSIKFLGCIMCYSPLRKVELDDSISLLERISGRLSSPIGHKMMEGEYHTLFNISPDPHCIIGLSGHIERYNQAFATLVGEFKNSLSGKLIFDIIHPEDLMGAKRGLISLVNGGSKGPFRLKILTTQGNVRIMLWSAAVSRESMCIIAVGKDITEQTLAEEELRTAHERLRSAQKIAKLGYWFRPADSALSVWSEETYHIYGCSPSSFIPSLENLKELYFPEDRHYIEDNPLKHLIPGETKGFEHRIITPLGQSKWVRQEVRFIVDNDGMPLKIEGTIQDITESKTYEKKLHMSNEIFKLAMQVSNEIIWHVDLFENKFTRKKDLEKSLEPELFEDFSITNTWFDSIDPRDREKVWQSLLRVINNKSENLWKAEYRVLSDDGTVHYYVDRCNILRDTSGIAVQLVGAALDVTSPRKQLEMIKEQNKTLKEIAWMQSHLLRAPLTRIMGLINISKEYDGGGLSTMQIMELIQESANELDVTIQTIIEKANLLDDGKQDYSAG